jgi:hypothetical protein
MTRILLAAALSLAFAGAAYAGSCPTQVKAIDEALAKNASLSADKKAQAQKLRDEGDALHKAGKHPESMAKLAEAKKVIGIQ